ncbi:MAG: hypothetical protein JJE17_03920 [Peptostreptococcaceae bacterium]|nr:hypothetical protein [Peptostreptococcaceae bacterium]HZK10748.1 hypothetical protein [Atribacterota bacterium]
MIRSKIDNEQIYNTSDLQELLGIGKDNAYKIMHTVGFHVSPKSMRVRHTVLFDYLEKEAS